MNIEEELFNEIWDDEAPENTLFKLRKCEIHPSFIKLLTNAIV